MTREEFLKKMGLISLAAPILPSWLMSCTGSSLEVSPFQTAFNGKVLIVGAGAAGMTAAYLLQRAGVEYELIEASGRFGGRLKRDTSLADFPIDLGAEWIHTSPTVLSDILQDGDAGGSIEYITYNPQTIQLYKDGEIKDRNFASNFYSEWKFKRTTWYGFFERYMIPLIEAKTVFNAPVAKIDQSGGSVVITDDNGQTYTGDKALVTIPIKVLQDAPPTFIPAMPTATRDAIDSIFMGDGLKVFIEFQERFYPDLLMVGSVWEALSNDEKVYYDAAFRKNSNRNILGLFSVNEPAGAFTQLGSDQAIIDAVLAELDEMFDGQASEHYLNHVIQNWSAEPYIRGAYSYGYDNNFNDTIDALAAPIGDHIYLAGEAVNKDNSSTAHGAAESAYDQLERMLNG